MPQTSFTETNFENAVLELIQSLGYTRLYGPDIPRDYRNPLYETDLLPAEDLRKTEKEVRASLPEGLPCTFISSVSGQGIEELKDNIWKAING